MTVCVVNGCHNASDKDKKPSNITFHMFPSDPIVSARWIDKIRLNRNESYWKPTKNSKICSIHFDETEKYITKGGLCRLRRGAIPTKNVAVFCATMYDVKVMDESNQPPPGTSVSEFADSEALKTPICNLSPIFDTPKKASLRRQLNRMIIRQKIQSRKIKILKQKNRRLLKKNISLHNILVTLRKERYIDNDVSNILSENVFAADLYNSLDKKRKNNKRPMPKYTPEFRKFCLTLHFYSPRAYTYVRKTYDTCLPHPKTIYNWYRSINGSPGLTTESFQLLKFKVQSTEKRILCVLIADEMAIRPQNLKGGQGRVDMGTGTSDSTTQAREAYTFILVCLNEHWKLPLGYFLVHSLSGAQKVNLIKMCLTKCDEVGIKVVALTFDAHSTNISAMELLGCRLKNAHDIKTTFKHPSADHHVAVFLDSNHMVKLVRNHFEDKEEFLDQNENKVAWKFLTKLNDLQEREGLHLANKLTRKHLEFRNSIMKVKLASQLLSRSVAVALQFCRETLKLEDFKDSQGTENFIMILNNLFDVFNSRRLTQHGFSHPLSNPNKQEIFEFLDKAKQYILNLQIKTTRKRKFNENQNAVNLRIKSFQAAVDVKCSPGFKGLVVCIESLKYLFTTLVEDTKELDYITTYRLSQDHIELLFGSIRMHGGHNDNPNALQFKGSYRKLLCHMELQVGETGNCVPLENIAILTCSSALTCINATSAVERFDEAEETFHVNEIPTADDIGYEIASHAYDDPDFKNHVVAYIAGNVVRNVIKKIKCQFCVNNMDANESQWFHKLVTMRDRGGLIYASPDVYVICNTAETYLRNHLKNNLNVDSEKKLTIKIVPVLSSRVLFNDLNEQHINAKYHDTNLVGLIVEQYLKIRLFYESKKDNILRFLSSKRNLLRKNLQRQGY